MANNITTNPWVLDTTTSDVIWPSNVFVDHFEYVNGGSAGDYVIVTGGTGVDVWRGEMDVDLQPDHSGKIGVVYGGLRLTHIDGGQLRVFLGKPHV